MKQYLLESGEVKTRHLEMGEQAAECYVPRVTY